MRASHSLTAGAASFHDFYILSDIKLLPAWCCEFVSKLLQINLFIFTIYFPLNIHLLSHNLQTKFRQHLQASAVRSKIYFGFPISGELMMMRFLAFDKSSIDIQNALQCIVRLRVEEQLCRINAEDSSLHDECHFIRWNYY